MPPTLAETWANKWEKNAKRGIYPFNFAPYEAVRRVMEKIIPLFEEDRESFTREFTAAIMLDWISEKFDLV